MAGYKYRGGSGAMPEAEVQARITAARAKLRGAEPPAFPVVPAAQIQAEVAADVHRLTGKPRCDECGYLLTRCSCPGGPRGGA